MTSPIHKSAIVSPLAKIGKNVEIGCFSIIHQNVTIEDNTTVGSHCEIGIPTSLGNGTRLHIGKNSLIRSHSVFYESSTFSDGLITGHHVKVRENTTAGLALQIGTASEIQGDCIFGNYVRLQSNVFMGKNTLVGNFVWILPNVILANDPTPPSNTIIGCELQDYSCVSAGSTILPGVVVGKGAVVGANSCVTKNVPSGMLAIGAPAIVKGEAKNIQLRDGSGRAAYPWVNHFHRGYPEDQVTKWLHNQGRSDD